MSTPTGSWSARQRRSSSACARGSRLGSTTSSCTCPASPTSPSWSSVSPGRSFPTSPNVGGFRQALRRLLRPLGGRCDFGLGLVAGTVEAGRGHSHEDPHLHIVVADGLTREAHLPEEITVFEYLELRLRHHVRLAFEVLDPAGGALSVRTTAVQDVHPGIFLDRQNQPLILRNVECPCAFDL